MKKTFLDRVYKDLEKSEDPKVKALWTAAECHDVPLNNALGKMYDALEVVLGATGEDLDDDKWKDQLGEILVREVLFFIDMH